jgi:hypothetical protein
MERSKVKEKYVFKEERTKEKKKKKRKKEKKRKGYSNSDSWLLQNQQRSHK